MIQFLKDTSKAIIPAEFENDTLVVYRDGYKLPKIDNAEYCEFEKYAASYTTYKPNNIILVGTNRIFVPQRRCEMVFEYLQTMTSHIRKMSIDTAPFVGEPWRLWFHYSVAYGEWLGFNYSYVVETDWQHWFYRDANTSVISADSISDKIGNVHSDLNQLTTSFEFYMPDLFEVGFYNEIKEFAFNKYGTPKQIIIIMLKELNKHFNIKFDFDSYLENRHIKLPNFGIYHFVAEECERRMNIFNTVVQ